MPAYDARPLELRKVPANCHFRFEGVRYSVPPEACGHTVTVRPSGERSGDRLSVSLGDELLVAHRRPAAGIRTVTLGAHVEQIRRLTRTDPARRAGRPRTQPAFEQTSDPDLDLLVTVARRGVPDVQSGTLDAYEQLVQGVA